MIRRSVLIDPVTRSLRTIMQDLDKPMVRERLIGSLQPLLLPIGTSLALIVDTMGAYRSDQEFFQFGAFPPPIGGKALLVRCVCTPAQGDVPAAYTQELEDMMHTEALLEKQVDWLTVAQSYAAMIAMGIPEVQSFGTMKRDIIKPDLQVVA